jgi:integrase/recombinase XerD
MSALATSPRIGVGFDPLKDSRHRAARAAREQADWLAWLELGGTRPRTLADYEWATARLLRAFPHKTLSEMTDGDLAQVLRTFPPRGRRTKKAPFDNWFKWALRTDRIAANPMEKLPAIAHVPQRMIAVFTDAEIAALTELPDNDGDLFLILFYAGLRRGEARRLQVRDCQLEPGQIVVREGKGGKDRVVPMSARLQQRLAKWFLLDALKPADYLWPTRPGGYYLSRRKPMGDTSFISWYKRCLNAADVPYRNPHVTRHSFATRWLRRGGQLTTLSRIMGHASIRTTFDQYGHLDTRDIERDLALVESSLTETT